MHPPTICSKHMAPLPVPSPQFLRTVSMWRLINGKRMGSSSVHLKARVLVILNAIEQPLQARPIPRPRPTRLQPHSEPASWCSSGGIKRAKKGREHRTFYTSFDASKDQVSFFPRGRALSAARFFPFLIPAAPAWATNARTDFEIIYVGNGEAGRPSHWGGELEWCSQGPGASAHLLGRPDRTNVRGIRSRLHCADAAVGIKD